MINKRAGVYKLVNTENNKIYIGSSKDLKERKYRHFYRLKRNKHNKKVTPRCYKSVVKL